jgi:glycosyltransferase involved in cell wall biosynthesis
MKLTCLLPVRNGEEELHEYLLSVTGFADEIIALDDGSTDSTREILEDCPAVTKIISNPRRETYFGWNDYENRSKLLSCAETSNPNWIIWIDADERLEKSDAGVLRHFLETEAQKRVPYSLEVLRAVGDLSHYDRCAFWVPRLYSYESGLTLKPRKLHLDLIPLEFGDIAPKRTSLRLLHKAGIDEESRQKRYRKYLESDPDREWLSEDHYRNLLHVPRNIKPVTARVEGAAIVID